MASSLIKETVCNLFVNSQFLHEFWWRKQLESEMYQFSK